MDGEFERARLSRDARRPILSPEGDNGSGAFLGKVTTSADLIEVGRFLLMTPGSAFGPKDEAGTVTLSSSGPSIPAVLLGPAKPSPGDYLIARFSDDRWVVERGTNGSGTGGRVGSIPDCICPDPPATLAMTSADPACNYRMFQSCTIQFGPTPTTYLPLNLGTNSYLSTTSFPDPVANGAMFQYYLTCEYNQWNLARVYLNSPYGSPYRDGVLYSWLIGGSGNTCTPFVLGNGTSFPGSDPSCSVTIEG